MPRLRTKYWLPVFGMAAALTLPSLATHAQTTSAVLRAPATLLRLGDDSSEVLALQKILNASPTTMVASSGYGAPGNETTFFGTKTFDAVKRFQTLYASEILYPQNLSTATGFVGPATLRKLQHIVAHITPAAVAASPTPPATTPVTPAVTTPAVSPAPQLALPIGTPAPIPLTPTMQIPAGTNPNSINLEYALATIEALGKKQGISAEQLEATKAAIKNEALTSKTDFRKEFFNSKSLIATSTTSLNIPPGYEGNLAVRILSRLGLLKVASAATAIPFGGAVFFVFPCTCSPGNWALIIEPLPPTYPTLLSYTTGTQLYASYNLPFSLELLGLELPILSTCFTVGYPMCWLVPTQGHITPVVGSAIF